MSKAGPRKAQAKACVQCGYDRSKGCKAQCTRHSNFAGHMQPDPEKMGMGVLIPCHLLARIQKNLLARSEATAETKAKRRRRRIVKMLEAEAGQGQHKPMKKATDKAETQTRPMAGDAKPKAKT